ncbi:hypothetical protein BJ322DRAFT_1109000 [Thelephora terrestris]|uniref:Uncharacterized protein n=1 Tax=Thelephora terrestris TaxID=56493 RepID=A0A9P6L7J3_9AGAM|nr:hypothetical protein BJ322DRAFT_1109000 [Thelephora terrestris]
MAPNSQGQSGVLSEYNESIEALNIANDSSIAPAKVVFGSVGQLLTIVKKSMNNKQDYVELGLTCADLCKALNRGLNGKKSNELSQSVLEAIEQLTTTVAEIQRKVTKQDKRNVFSRLFCAKTGKDTIAAWRRDLSRISQVFNMELSINNHIILTDIHRNLVASQECTQGQRRSAQASVPFGELPPPPHRPCAGRDELIGEIIGFAKNLEPIALIGAGGIGKTSIALAVLHHDRIKDRFGDNRRFIRCDQFPASLPHFLARLSKAIGAGVENAEDLAPLRPHLSSEEMILFLDNAESILDPQGTDARGIYAVVEELSRFRNICLCITSRISTLPPHCNRLTIPTLSMESACDIFYAIYKNSERSDIVKDLIQQLDFHALSIRLLATTAVHNMWDYDRLAKEWETHRAQVLRTDYNESLAETIELSLTSPTFRKLGPNARELLGVVAFFPQGVNENNLDWLFPTISDRKRIFDKFCILSLTHRSKGFITMLAPLRDYLGPRDPRASPLLRAIKDRYFNRLQSPAVLEHDKPWFRESRWITSEDANVKHLLKVFTSLDADSDDNCDTCANFMMHLSCHEPRSTALRPKIEGLPDKNLSKTRCSFEPSQLSRLAGNDMDGKRPLAHALKIGKEWGNDEQVALTLRHLAEAERILGLHGEGIQQLREASEIYEILGLIEGRAKCCNYLARFILEDQQLNAAEEAGSHAVNLFLDQGRGFWVYDSRHSPGRAYHLKGERKKAVRHFEAALGSVAPSDWHNQLFWIHRSLAELCAADKEFANAHAQIERAKSHAVDDPYCRGCAMVQRAWIWHQQGRPKEAKTEALLALETFEKLGSTSGLEWCRNFLGEIELAAESASTSESHWQVYKRSL